MWILDLKNMASTLGYRTTTTPNCLEDTLRGKPPAPPAKTNGHSTTNEKATNGHANLNTNSHATTTTPRLPAPVVIQGIATGVPEPMRKQHDTASMVPSLLHASPDKADRIHRLYAKTRIHKRHMAVDPLSPSFDRQMTIRKRMDLFLEHAAPLATSVCQRALSSAGITDPAQDIGLLVLVTSTGLLAPGVDIAVAQRLGLSPNVSRAVVNFMGCAAAMNGLRTAADYVRGRPEGKRALMCCVELSSVNAVYADTMNDIVISSLFADGCAAMVVASSSCAWPHGLKAGQVMVRDQFSHLVDGTRDGIVLGVNDTGITCDLSPKLPLYIRGGLAPVVDGVLRRHGMGRGDVDLWAIHPGGPKIIDESVRSLALDDGVATVSWNVLGEYGNMLSASLPFVLERLVARAKAGGENATGVAFSFAPGVTVEGLIFDVV